MKKIPPIINSNVEFVSDQSLINEAVKRMVDKEISSVLVHNDEQKIVGIVTERDIVRKFTLLQMSDKLTRKVSTIMSRPVQFARLSSLHDDIVRLHIEQRFRHFPVLQGKDQNTQEVVGIVSITDFLRPFLEQNSRFGLKSTEVAEKKENKPKLAILGHSPMQNKTHAELFSKMGLDVAIIENHIEFFNQTTRDSSQAPPLLFDFDAYGPKELKNLILLVRKYHGKLIMATSNFAYIPLFRKHLIAEKQVIALKPIDISYCYWLVAVHWQKA